MFANGHLKNLNDPENEASRRRKVVRFESRDRTGPHWSRYIRRVTSWALGVRDVRQNPATGG